MALQITLGIYTIWTNKAADVATAHVAVGASLLVWAVLSYIGLQRWRAGVTFAIDVPQNRRVLQPVEAAA